MKNWVIWIKPEQSQKHFVHVPLLNVALPTYSGKLCAAFMCNQVVWWDVSCRLWFLSGGRGALVQASALVISCTYSLKMWAGRRGLLWPHRLPALCIIRGWTLLRCGTEKQSEVSIHLERNAPSAQAYTLLVWLCICSKLLIVLGPLALEWIVLYTIISRPEWWWWPPFSSDPQGMEIIPNPCCGTTDGQNRAWANSRSGVGTVGLSD